MQAHASLDVDVDVDVEAVRARLERGYPDALEISPSELDALRAHERRPQRQRQREHLVIALLVCSMLWVVLLLFIKHNG